MVYSNIFKSMSKYDELYLDGYEYDKVSYFVLLSIKIVFCRNYA